MAENDRIVLDEVLEQRRNEVDPGSSESAFFELFSAEQVLKDFDLSYDEIAGGLVGDGGDGGIDGLYLLVNGELVQDETDVSQLKKDITLDLVLIQAKRGVGFAETPVERFITISDDILDLSKPLAPLRSVYNPALVEAISRFRDIHKTLAARFPAIRLSYYYCGRGVAQPATGIRRKVEKLAERVNVFFPSALFSFSFVGAAELLSLTRRGPSRTHQLPLAETPISLAGQSAFVCLVSLSDFFAFITDDRGTLRRPLFEANVRDYQGSTEVNELIQRSLAEGGTEDFWWLDNGVTVVAGRASLSAKVLTLEDPEIVNGLQTSREIYNYFAKEKRDGEERRVLLRVLVPPEPASRDRIIKATNSQNPVSPASLRATEAIHRNIEEILRPRGLYYDRRKNYYKNEGKPRDRIIGIPLLAQSVMAILLQRPDTARARPSSLLKSDDAYKKVFNPKIPIEVYWVCAAVVRRVEQFLKLQPGLSAADRNNMRFYVALDASARLAGTVRPTVGVIASLDPARLSDEILGESLADVYKAYRGLGGDDQVAKGSALRDEVLATLKGKLAT